LFTVSLGIFMMALLSPREGRGVIQIRRLVCGRKVARM
jgi:hypothetical protein